MNISESIKEKINDTININPGIDRVTGNLKTEGSIRYNTKNEVFECVCFFTT